MSLILLLGEVGLTGESSPFSLFPGITPVTLLDSLLVIWYKAQCLSGRDPTGENTAYLTSHSAPQV